MWARQASSERHINLSHGRCMDVTGAWRWVGTQKVGRRTVCETTGEVLIFALGGRVGGSRGLKHSEWT